MRFDLRRLQHALVVCLLLAGALILQSARAAATITSVCPAEGIQLRGPAYPPGGIILTSFDRGSMWVYNVDDNRRYPLPDTNPCGTNCRLSHDARWITYVDALTNAYSKMRLDGTQRTPLVDYAADLEWWAPETLLIWTPGKDAYLRPETSDTREYLDVHGIISVQPNGRWGLLVEQQGDDFRRALIDLETRGLQGISGKYISLGIDQPYFDAAAWSSDGQWLAYVAPGPADPQTGITGGELLGIRPAFPDQLIRWTNLTGTYGPVRINGRTSTELSWSPDSSRIAFWVIKLSGPDPEVNTGEAVLHVLTVATGEVRSYCGFTTLEHTPNPPRLIWAPDNAHLALGGNIPGDEKGYLLLALDIESGIFTQLSDGIYPSFGGANPIAWGLAP